MNIAGSLPQRGRMMRFTRLMTVGSLAITSMSCRFLLSAWPLRSGLRFSIICSTVTW